MRNRAGALAVVAGLLCAGFSAAQDIPLPSGSISIRFPDDSPLLLAGSVTDQSRATARGAAMVIDLRLAMELRNVSPYRIHGVTIRVVSQEVTLGGKGSVSYPSLHVGPGETFPARIDMQLVRPTQSIGSGPLVEVNLDGVLYQDLSFYGPDRLNSRRMMTAWEMEAQRDRAYFKRILAQSGPEALRDSMLESLTRQAQRPRLDVRVTRGGSAVTSAGAAALEHTAQFAFLRVPGAPVSAISGNAQIAANEARAPSLQLRNDSNRPVKYVELGWVVADRNGSRYLAASLPAGGSDLVLRPGETTRAVQDASLKFSRDGQPWGVQQMSGFINQVEFADGKEPRMWVPTRQSLQDTALLPLVAPSAEEQRLTDIYRKKGINALVDELKKY